ncbi:Fur-regulated basic protein FbpA [Niallia circulans]|uniref:Fur-regulated basic protein FbpA n=1 Tax=Niallia circulans TaxID=1397 RepID=UPI00397A188E
MNLDQEKDELKCELINRNYFKTPDGRQLYELSFEELKSILNEVKKNETYGRVLRTEKAAAR